MYTTDKKPFAVVLGDIDMLRPLGLAGIPCAVVADSGDMSRYSRFASKIINWSDPEKNPSELIESLITFASAQEKKPVLFYESDAYLLLISRNRKLLSEYFRFVIPDENLVEDLVDKSRFQKLAEKLFLPVPKTRLLSSQSSRSARSDIQFPAIIKPLSRKPSAWKPIAGLSKAIRIETHKQLDEFVETLKVGPERFILQEHIPGAETEVESYHAYVDEKGEIVGEFTGKKIRTYPKEFGQSCALVISDAEDVRNLGREITKKVNLRGFAKFDFKRAPDGKLFLLEINPRCSLWLHLAAVAGMNLPETAYCDLVGLPRPKSLHAKPGASWCRVGQDVFAAREAGVPFFSWLKWAAQCDAKPGFAWDDPLPIVGALVGRTWNGFKTSSMKGLQAAIRLMQSSVHKAAKVDASESDLNQSTIKNTSPSKLKVLMVTSEFPNEESPNAVPFIVRHVKYLRRSGIDVDLFHFQGKKNLFNYIGAWNRLRKHMKSKNYDLMHAQWGHSAAPALPKSLPWVITFRGNDLEGIIGRNGRPTFLGKILTVVSKTMARLADSVIVVSESLARHLARKDYQIIPSGLDLDVFRPMPKSEARELLGLSQEKKLVLFAASAIDNPRKRYSLASEAIELIRSRIDAELVVVTGVPHGTVPLYMSACDALLLTSVHEGSPNVVKEALACNLPVVSVDVGDVRERLAGIAGCCVCDDDSPQTISLALEKVLTRNERIEGRVTVEELDERNVAHKVIEVYREVLNRRYAAEKRIAVKSARDKLPSRL